MNHLEFGLIEEIKSKTICKQRNTIKGIGDDAAVISISKDEALVISTDMLTEGVHFDLTYTPLIHLGYKAITTNLSDIYAMNARAEQILVSIGISNKFSVEAVKEIYKGINVACKLYDVDLVGGDTTSLQKGLTMSITAIGRSATKKITYRDKAKEGDFIFVTGDLGGAYLGLQILEREKAVFNENPETQPELNKHKYLLQRQLRPEARKDILDIFKKMNVLPTAMIDLSDGLASEILHICKNSTVGARLFEEKIPIDPSVIKVAEEFNINPTTCALNGGEDYELLFTVKKEDALKFKHHPDFTKIGEITRENKKAFLILKGGERHKIVAQGWDSLLERG